MWMGAVIPPLLEWGLRTIYELKSEYPLLVYARFRIDIVVGSEDSGTTQY